MKQIVKLEFIKLLWTILLIAIVSLLIKNTTEVFFFSGNTLDIHLHDTYFIIEFYQFWIVLFGIAHFCVNTLYCINTKHFNWLSNSVYCLEIVLVYLIAEAIANFFTASTSGWTSYPPLSALYFDVLPEETNTSLFSFSLIAIPFLLYQFLFVWRWWRWSKTLN